MKNILCKLKEYFIEPVDKEAIKFNAVLTMLIDHLFIMLYQFADFDLCYYFGRFIGRFSFPLFAFCLVDGYMRTSNKKRYFIRLLILAIVSEIPFNLFISGQVIDWSNKNVIFTYLLGFLLLEAWDRLLDVPRYIKFCYVFCFCFIAILFNVDYSFFGILLILVYYLCPVTDKKNLGFYIMLTGFSVFVYGCIGLFIYPAFMYLQRYDGKFCNSTKRKYNPKPMNIYFYLFYPVHLIVLFLIGLIC